MTTAQPGNGGPERDITLSIIIVTFEARNVVIDCLESIGRNPPCEPFEIIVVDNGSTDGTSDVLPSRFPQVRLVRVPINGPYAVANNRALALARGRYLCLLNNDTVVLPQAFDRMIEFLREHPEAGAVGSQLLNEDGTTQVSVKPLPTAAAALFGARSIITQLLPRNRYSRKQLLHLDCDMMSPLEAGYISGAASMHPREVVEKVGELDHRLFYFVDADYCKRVADAGYKCYYLPTASIVHLNHKGGSRANVSERIRRVADFHVGAYIYYRKHVQQSPWSLMHVLAASALFGRFIVTLTAQACTEASTLVGSRFTRYKPVQ
jgi:N-acetylglucosaminyl-diphospho-decaprenol L-rhamnosyltransferase